MCDSCGVKIGILSRKNCTVCRQLFCELCMGKFSGVKRCKRCEVFALPIIRRRDLESFQPHDLLSYFRHSEVNPPTHLSKEDLVQLILGEQARVLNTRASAAVDELNGVRESPTTDGFVEVGADLLGSRSSTSSSSGVAGVDGGSVDWSGARIRAEVKRQDHLRRSRVETVLGDIRHESQLAELTVKQLKTVLQRNCVDYKGCVEKQELLERVVRLWHSIQEQKVMEAKIDELQDIDAESEFLCKICMDSPVNCVLLECGHMLTCVKCGRQLAECPVCRQYVSRVVHAFKV